MPNSITGVLTGGLFDPGGADYGKIAGRNERKRQGLINLGMKQINALFEGGSAPFYSLASQDPFTRGEWKARDKSQDFYYLSPKGRFDPFMLGKRPEGSAAEGAVRGAEYGSVVPGIGTLLGATTGGIVGGLRSGDYTGAGLSAASGGLSGLLQGAFGKDAPTVRERINARLKKGLLFNAPTNEQFEGFQPSFYDKRRQDYVDYALPQLADQYRTNRNAILYGLENRGVGQSTVADQARSALERTVGQGRQQIADTGQAQADQLRRDVEGSRQQAIQQLYQTADPAQAFGSALKSYSELQRPTAFGPITDMFGNLARQYYTSQLLNAYRQPYGLGGTQQGVGAVGNLGPVTY